MDWILLAIDTSDTSDRSLLDRIRHTQVQEGEAGGITQVSQYICMICGLSSFKSVYSKLERRISRSKLSDRRRPLSTRTVPLSSRSLAFSSSILRATSPFQTCDPADPLFATSQFWSSISCTASSRKHWSLCVFFETARRHSLSP